MPDAIPEILLYDPIDSLSPAAFHANLQTIADNATLRVRINSPGGSLTDGFAVLNLLRARKGKKIVTVDGLAASAASLVAMGGDEIEMGQGAFMFLHNPLWMQFGDSEDMRSAAEVLEKFADQIVAAYARRTGRAPEEIRELMDADTWMSAEEAVAMRFADRVVDAPAIAASFDLRPFGYHNVPASLLTQPTQGEMDMAKEPVNAATANEPQAATCAELKGAIPKADDAFLVAQLTKGATLPQAQAAWSGEVERRLEAANQTIAELRAAAEKHAPAATKKPGVQTLGNGAALPTDSADADPIAAFDAAVAANIKAGMSRTEAVRALVKRNPEVHRAYLDAVNA